MKNSLTEKILGLIFIISVVLFVFIVCIYLIKDFMGKEYLIALIGFSGSIIGGALTLVGVKLTISNENKKERIKMLPKYINDSWRIQNAFAFPFGLYISLKDNPKIDDEKEVKNFYNKYELWVTEISATVSPEVYDLVNSYFTHIDEYSFYKNKGQSEKWFNMAYKYHEKLGGIIDEFEKEYKRQ